jgi:hypothetical protein
MALANVYIDGFNLYYGCLKGSPYRWLDLRMFSSRVLPCAHTLHRVRYFTARVRAHSHDPDAPRRQQTYLRALATLPATTIEFGHFLSSIVMMPLASPAPSGPRFARVIKSEEKGSDVNLACRLLLDGFNRDCEVALVVSNDSDLLMPIRVARRELGLTIGLASPFPTPSRVLAAEVDFVRPIWPETLRRSQLPDPVFDSRGALRKPAAWS